MKKETLYEAIGDIDEKYICEARSRKNIWPKLVAFAASAAIIIGVSAVALTQIQQGVTEELPLLTIGEDSKVGYGFEGYMAHDISELVSGNPWSESDKITSLPVYKNPLSYDEDYIAHGGSFDNMREFLLEIVGRLGLDTNSVEITDNTPTEEEIAQITEKFGGVVPEGYFDATAVIAEYDGIRIEVDLSMTATIFFDLPVELPEQYSFSKYATYEDFEKVADYLKEEYRSLIGGENPQANIYGGDYNTYGEQNYQLEFFDGSGDTVNRIINFNFNRTAFYSNSDGKLYMARVYQPDLSEKVGDYPIISVEKAKELLLNGNYITSCPCDFPGEEYIAKVELGYRGGPREQYFMPYYRFYVELPNMDMGSENGCKTYGVYYVPAVEKKYISDMPVWDGSFN